jgi:outer membrane protein OmpA-like peptidoglycan-associated protein
MRFIFLIVFSFCFYISLFSGGDNNRKYIRAKDLFESGNYAEALKIYLDLYLKDSSNCNISYKVGTCYLNTGKDAKRALFFLQRASKRVSVNYNEFSYKEKAAPVKLFKLLGDALHLNYQFEDAILSYKKYLGSIIEDVIQVRAIEKKIRYCENGKTLIKSPVAVIIKNCGENINTAFQEYAPKLTSDRKTMFFTSKRPDNVGGKTYDGGQYFEDIYITRNKGGVWQKAENLGSPVNTMYNEAAVSVSADGQQMLIYKDDLGDGNIYFSSLQGTQWSVPVKLNSNINSKHWEPAACLSADGNTIYFVSDRPGGYGGTDIYKCIKTPKGDWGKAVNLGSVVNTEEDEHTPFIHADGQTLYFSSKGHKSIGGFDVFVSILDSERKKWSVPKNIGYPINTTGDDAFFILTTDKKSGFYSSSVLAEDGFGEKDIYEIFFAATETPALSLIKGQVKSCAGLCSEVEITVSDNKSGEVLAVYYPNSDNSEYSFILTAGKSHNVTFQAEGYMFCSVAEYSGEGFIEKDSSVCLQPIKQGSVAKLNNIYFDFDESRLRKNSLIELDRLYYFLENNKRIHAEISGYADSKGSDSYNLKLSHARAQSVVNYLIERGISASRLKAEGYGTTKNQSDMKIHKGTGLNPSERRVEVKIISIDKE